MAAANVQPARVWAITVSVTITIVFIRAMMIASAYYATVNLTNFAVLVTAVVLGRFVVTAVVATPNVAIAGIANIVSAEPANRACAHSLMRKNGLLVAM